MRNEFDLAGYSANRQLVLVVEVKYMQETSDENAAFFRRNLVSHGLLSTDPYFLLAYRTTIFLWKANSQGDAKPSGSASMKPLVRSFLKPTTSDDEAVGRESLEFAVKNWLSEIASGTRAPDEKFEPDKMLMESGLYDRLKGGEIRRHAVE
jgi:hypothetical protein